MYTCYQNIKTIIRLCSCYKATTKIRCIETRNANFCKLILHTLCSVLPYWKQISLLKITYEPLYIIIIN